METAKNTELMEQADKTIAASVGIEENVLIKTEEGPRNDSTNDEPQREPDPLTYARVFSTIAYHLIKSEETVSLMEWIVKYYSSSGVKFILTGQRAQRFLDSLPRPPQF